MFGARAQPALASWWIERLGLSGLEDRYPDELSEGQQRRVAIARALAIAPCVLLLDEPFSGLDAAVRSRLRRELRRLQREANLSTVIVTHDPEDAALLADDVIILGDGSVLQSGAREGVFRAPGSPEVAELLGITNTHRGSVLSSGILASHGVEIRAPTNNLPAGTKVVWCVRPERVLVSPSGRHPATLVDDIDLGTARELTMSLNGALELTVRTGSTQELTIGAPLRIDIADGDITVWPASAPPSAATA